MPARTALILFVGISLAGPFCARSAQAQVLQNLREEVRTEEPEERRKEKEKKRLRKTDRHRHDDDEDCDEDESLGDVLGRELIVKPLLITVSAPFWYPPYLIGDDYAETAHFPRHPYARNARGSLLLDIGSDEGDKFWMARSRFEVADDFDRLARIGGHFLLDSTARFGLDTSVDYRTERLAAGGTDELWTGDMNLLFRFAQAEHLQMRTGLGFNWLSDPVGSDFGFNFTYMADFYPAEPWVISSELDLGALGDATLLHWRTTAGVQVSHLEFFTGYDHYSVGRVKINGMVAGVRVSF